MKKFFVVLLLAPATVLAQSLSGVESVEYDPINDRYLASSDNTSIVEIAPDGTLSHFGSGLDADYGMEVMGNTLFAVTGSTVKGYDLTTEMEVMRASIPGASFLNGLTNNGNSTLWVTDFGNGRIIEIDASNFGSPTTNVIVNSTGCTPNGIVYDEANYRLIFVCWGSSAAIKQVDLSNNQVSNLVANTGVGNIDGIDQDNDGNYYISHWSPNGITKYNNDFSSSEAVTTPSLSSPADICYAMGPDTLAIPGGGQVVFVGFETSVGIEEPIAEADFGIYPNPANGGSIINLEMAAADKVVLTLHDVAGKLIAELMNGTLQTGNHQFGLSDLELTDGTYICKLNKGGSTTSSKFIYTK
jgi:hypothetical protein